MNRPQGPQTPTNQREPTEQEQEALLLANQIKAYRQEVAKWQVLVDNVENEAARQMAECYKDVWESEVKTRVAKLKDLNTEIGLTDIELDE